MFWGHAVPVFTHCDIIITLSIEGEEIWGVGKRVVVAKAVRTGSSTPRPWFPSLPVVKRLSQSSAKTLIHAAGGSFLNVFIESSGTVNEKLPYCAVGIMEAGVSRPWVTLGARSG